MPRDYTKICRVCMAEGSRDIFPRNLTAPGTFGAAAAGDGRSVTATASSSSSATSPLDRLLEKLRYVTMMKIDESDDLPRLLCDLCIVQLNVAYNFKRQAVENDTKLRQYFIENGISSSQYNTDASTMNPGRTSARSTFPATSMATSQRTVSRHIPVIPFVVKSEVTEIDGLSEVAETISNDQAEIQLNTSNNTNSSSSQTENGQNNSGGVSEGGTNSSMVYMINGTPSSEVEFVLNSSALQGSSRNSTVNRHNLVDSEESHFIQRLKMNSSSKSTERHCDFEDESPPQKTKKQKIQSSSIDLDIKERMLEAPEVRRLAIDSNFQPSTTPRQSRSVKTPAPGMTHRISGTQTERLLDKVIKDSSNKTSSDSNQRIGKKPEKRIKSKVDCNQSKTGKSVKITSTPHRTDSRKMLPNPFTPTMTTSEKLLQRIKTIRGKRPPEKVFRPKINPSTNKKLNKSTSTK